MTRIPKPGAPVRSSETGRPIMALLDLASRRWLLRIVWELRGDPLTFRALRTAAGELSPTLLNQRLKELRAARLVEIGSNGYALTVLGRSFMAALEPLLLWSEVWARELDGASPD